MLKYVSTWANSTPVLNTYLHKPKYLFTKETGTAPKVSARAPLCCKCKEPTFSDTAALSRDARTGCSSSAHPINILRQFHRMSASNWKTWKALVADTNTWFELCCLSPFVMCNSINLGILCVCKTYIKTWSLRTTSCCIFL